MTRFTVLGGGSPFTAALLAALAAQPPAVGRDAVMLWGGAEDSLRALATHGSLLLRASGGEVKAETNLAAALDGAEVIIHQIRYGHLEGRARAEALARRWGFPPDETLGPGGLLTGLFIATGLGPIATAVAERAPTALVVMMTNPLSVSTTLAADWGLKVVGCCELPELTAQAAYAAAGVSYEPDGWACTGLNHRGFIHCLRSDGSDLLARLAGRLLEQRQAAEAADLAELGAVPTKYFALVRGRSSAVTDRAGPLAELRAAITAELQDCPGQPPASLAGRPTPWYDEMVVPLARALESPTGRRLVLTVPGLDGFAREQLCQVSAGGITPLTAPPPPATVERWLARFEEHEQAVLLALCDPSVNALRAALAADPCVGRGPLDSTGVAADLRSIAQPYLSPS